MSNTSQTIRMLTTDSHNEQEDMVFGPDFDEPQKWRKRWDF